MDLDYFAHPTACIDEGAVVGAGSKVWHFAHVSAGAVIGVGCSLGQGVFVAAGVSIGRGSRIQNNVSLYEGVTLEEDVFCGPSVVFTNVRTPRAAFPRKGVEPFVATLVKRGASLGANATVICGVTIGEHALVGAGAVVTRDVAPYALVHGNPAHPCGWVCECGDPLRPIDHDATCPRCERAFRLTGGAMTRVR